MNKIQLPGVWKGPGNSTWPSQVHCRYCFQFDHKCYMLKVWILIWVYIFFNSHQPQIPQIPKLSFWPRLEHNSLAAQCSHSISFCTHHLQIMESVLDVTHCEKKNTLTIFFTLNLVFEHSTAIKYISNIKPYLYFRFDHLQWLLLVFFPTYSLISCIFWHHS